MSINTVSFSVVSEIAIVPERLCKTPTLIGAAVTGNARANSTISKYLMGRSLFFKKFYPSMLSFLELKVKKCINVGDLRNAIVL